MYNGNTYYNMGNSINSIAGCKVGLGVMRAITEDFLFERWFISLKRLSQKKVENLLYLNILCFFCFKYILTM